jgi:acyl-coenzyme A synthetase/AMP-(fatty) acid ligase
VLNLTPDDVCFSVPKIFFSYGFGNSITFPFSVGAASLLMPGRATPAAVFAAVAQYRPTVFYGLPTLYTLLTHAPEIKDADFSSVRLAVSAAEILSTEIFNAWKQATGLEIVECLGSTEMLNVYLSNTPEHKRLGSAGMRVPATKSCSKTISATKCRTGAKARCGFAAIPARRCSGTSRSELRRRSATAAGYAPAIGWSATRMDFTSSMAAGATW